VVGLPAAIKVAQTKLDPKKMYESGSITGYEVMMNCLQMLDPDRPELVLSELPEEILDEMLA
jgi:hypothetical protein